MVFSSLPLYLDPPNSWNQPPHTHQPAGAGVTSDDHQQPPPAASAGPGPARPGSMAERARLAKIPQPEAALTCPRCDSNNTKFCYFNNYSLSQPRHFCKTCRRYWTRGGTLRNVPVGGGCRRNKRGGKSSSLMTSTAASPKPQPSKSSTWTAATTAPTAPANLVLLSAAPPLSLLAVTPWNQQQEYGYVGQGLEQWKLPYLGGMEAVAGMQVAAPASSVVAGIYGYHEEEWSVGGSIKGNEGGWMSNSIHDHALGFGGSSSTGNANL